MSAHLFTKITLIKEWLDIVNFMNIVILFVLCLVAYCCYHNKLPLSAL